MGEGRSFLVAVVAGSLAAGSVLAVFSAVDANHPNSNAVLDLIEECFAASFFAFPFVAFAGVFIGLPIALVLRRMRVRSFPGWLLVGLLSGGAVGVAFLPVFFYPVVLGFVAGAVPGMAAAAVWWLLAERHQSRDLCEDA